MSLRNKLCRPLNLTLGLFHSRHQRLVTLLLVMYHSVQVGNTCVLGLNGCFESFDLVAYSLI